MKQDGDEEAVRELKAFRDGLRRQLIERRENLPDSLRVPASAAIHRHLACLLARLAPGCLAFCWPYRGEFDARPLMGEWLSAGRRAALPVVVGTGQAMVFREWRPESAMHADRYGIPVPTAGEAVLPEVMLVPVNGFDAQGYRLGYGGGYFDRTLATLHPRPLTIGVGFEIARVDSIRPQALDARLDYLVTEAGIWQTNGQAHAQGLQVWPVA